MPLVAAIPHAVAFFGVILFGCAILLAVRILAGEGDRRGDLLHQTLRRVAWMQILAGMLAMLISAGVIPALVALIVFPAVVHRRRRSQRYALLAAMAVAVERRIPLIPVLLAFATERRGYVARRAMELATRIQEGYSLPDAVDSVRGLFPPPIRLAVRMGHDSGHLAEVLRQVLDGSDTYDTVESQIFGKITYFVVVFFFMVSIAGFMMMKIVPAFQKIFDEFGVELPGMTILMIKLAYGFVNFWYLVVPLILIPLFVLGVGSVLRYMGVLERDVPGTAWLRRRVHTATILETLTLFAKAGRPIVEAVAALAQWYPAGRIRRRLARALHEIRQGRDWGEALRRRRLISAADRGVLAAAERVGNLPWASAELAAGNRRRYAIKANAVLQSLFVAVLLGYGFVVAFFFIANFLPLVKLIHSLH